MTRLATEPQSHRHNTRAARRPAALKFSVRACHDFVATKTKDAMTRLATEPQSHRATTRAPHDGRLLLQFSVRAVMTLLPRRPKDTKTRLATEPQSHRATNARRTTAGAFEIRRSGCHDFVARRPRHDDEIATEPQSHRATTRAPHDGGAPASVRQHERRKHTASFAGVVLSGVHAERAARRAGAARSSEFPSLPRTSMPHSVTVFLQRGV